MGISGDLINKIKGFKIELLDLIWLMLFPILNLNYIFAANLAKVGKNIETSLDKSIPFEIIFIIPYVYWYLFIAIALVYTLSKSRVGYMRIFVSIILGMCCCYVVYYIFPTQITRPYVDNSNILNRLIKFIYSKDKPFNCFPSIHVLNTYFIMRYAKYEYGKGYFYYTQIVGILIILSTLFIKQHFVLDILGSVLLCEVIIHVVNKVSDISLNKILNMPKKIRCKIVENKEINL